MDSSQQPLLNLDQLAKIVQSLESAASNVASFNSQFAGHLGERIIKYVLTYSDLPGRMRCWSNVLVPKKGSVVDEAEIDVLMLHERGIFVFESKNYSGWIFGSEDQRQWTQMLNRNSKFRFVNPIRQNAGHIQALSKILVRTPEDFVSYIVFSDRSELKKVPREGKGYRICHCDDMLRLLLSDINTQPIQFTEYEFSAVEKLIGAMADASTQEAREFHAQDVKMASSGDTCPRCGAKLVERNGKRGPFMGCSNYPRCRFTRNIN